MMIIDRIAAFCLILTLASYIYLCVFSAFYLFEYFLTIAIGMQLISYEFNVMKNWRDLRELSEKLHTLKRA